ncbi:MAG: hypothetical protein JW891_09835 [Candidatus Lokiarchaeota archaeon]|nr:hypothetical protein [Candidatus Lokiarchaeota archaeon]
MVDKKVKALRVDLNKVLAADLLEIKNYYGIQSDSDMIRFLIREHKKELLTKEDFQLLSSNQNNNGAYLLQENGSYEKIPIEELNFAANNFDPELVRFNLTPQLLSNVLRAIMSKKPVLLIIEQEFIYKHVINFFSFILEDTFDIDIACDTFKNYKKNESNYLNHVVLKGDEVLKDLTKTLSKKKLKVEKEIVQKFYSETDPRFSLVILKNEITKAFIMAKKMMLILEKGEKISSKEIANFLKLNFPFEVNLAYIEFLNFIIQEYHEVKVPEIYNTLSDFL